MGVQRHWRRRVWSYDYMLRYKEMRIVEWEATFTENHWDLEVRDKLTYFLKAKWRCLFLFERGALAAAATVTAITAAHLRAVILSSSCHGFLVIAR